MEGTESFNTEITEITEEAKRLTSRAAERRGGAGLRPGMGATAKGITSAAV
jgi:hypothetical protein